MSKRTLAIKNMVCNRCVMVVGQVLEETGLAAEKLTLGEAILQEEPTAAQLTQLQQKLSVLGFELLDDKRTALVEKIKNQVVELIHQTEQVDLKVNLSSYLQDKLGVHYSTLSNLFSEVTGTTIEKYVIEQKIERAKELLVYDEKSLSEISVLLGYSSVQHLSTQFKKVTGLTPSQFKILKEKGRRTLDEI